MYGEGNGQRVPWEVFDQIQSLVPPRQKNQCLNPAPRNVKRRQIVGNQSTNGHELSSQERRNSNEENELHVKSVAIQTVCAHALVTRRILRE